MVLENNSFCLTISLLSIQILKNYHSLFICYTFYHLFLHHFFNSKLCLVCLLQYFFITPSKNFFSIKIFYYVFPQRRNLNFFNHKSFFWSIWNVNFYKNIFDILTWSPTSNLGSLLFFLHWIQYLYLASHQQASFKWLYDMYYCIH